MPLRRLFLSGAGSLALWSGAALARPHRAAPAHKTTAKPAKSGDDDDDSGSDTATAATGSPAQTPVGPLDTEARWAFIQDFNTGTVLLQKAADERMPPSSLTKLMTAYITFSMLKSGRLHLDQPLPVSEKAWRMQGSKMFVPLGSSIPVSQLIQGMVIQSGNDACIVLAEGISGSEDQFVALMNQEAAKLGMTNTHFENCTGWPAPDHYMSARDIGTLAHHIIADYPEYYHFFSEKDFRFNNISQGNRNVLVDKGLADGLKTGHTDAGGFGLCASSDHGGHRITVVVNGLPSSKARASEGERLLGWAFANFENVTLLKKGQDLQTAKVWLGEAPTVPLQAGGDLTVTVPHGWQNKVKVSLDYQVPLPAPIAAGQQVGTITIAGASVDPIELPLVAGAAVPRMGLISRSVAVLGHLAGRA